MSDAIIVDIDGTIADKGDRNPYDFSRVGEDTVIEPIRELVHLFDRTHWVIYVSGRSEDCRDVTEKWLRSNGFPWDHYLFMRPSEDYRPDEIVKAEIYHRDIEPEWDVRYVLDDRNKVVKMWRSLGLTCLQVAEGDF